MFDCTIAIEYKATLEFIKKYQYRYAQYNIDFLKLSNVRTIYFCILICRIFDENSIWSNFQPDLISTSMCIIIILQ